MEMHIPHLSLYFPFFFRKGLLNRTSIHQHPFYSILLRPVLSVKNSMFVDPFHPAKLGCLMVFVTIGRGKNFYWSKNSGETLVLFYTLLMMDRIFWLIKTEQLLNSP